MNWLPAQKIYITDPKSGYERLVDDLAKIKYPQSVNYHCRGIGTVVGKVYTKKFKAKNGQKRTATHLSLMVAGSSAKSRFITCYAYDHMAEGCARWMEKYDVVGFEGIIRYDERLSKKFDNIAYVIYLTKLDPQYTADGREFCARRNAMTDRDNEWKMREMAGEYDDLPVYLDKLMDYENNKEDES